MAFDFGAALSSAGDITPAYQQAKQNILDERELAAERKRKADEFPLQQRERLAQTVSTEQRNKQWVPMRSYKAADGSSHTVYFTPEGLKDLVDEEDPFTERQKIIERLAKSDPELIKGMSPEQLGQWKLTGQITSATRPNATSSLTPELRAAQLKLQQSRLALDEAKFRASQDPNNPVYRLKLRVAQNTALRDQAYWERAQAAVTGTLNGQPLPGAYMDASGQPVGSMFQGNLKPTSTEIGRADLATSALEQMDTMGEILLTRTDLFGPAAGRETNITQWIGSQDPDAQRFRAAARTTADHLAGVFGGRSKEALQGIYDIIGKNQTNPEAAIAAINQLAVAAKRIQARGTRHVVGGVPGTDNPTVKMRAPNGQIQPVPADQVDHYKSLGAVVVP